MAVITMTYPARCKHCAFCRTIRRRTYCTHSLNQDNPLRVIPRDAVTKDGKPIRQRDLACKDFKIL